MRKYIDISKYSSLGLFGELGENIHSGKCNITCVDKEKRRMSYIHRMSFKDMAEAVFDETDRFEFYYEEDSEKEEADKEIDDKKTEAV